MLWEVEVNVLGIYPNEGMIWGAWSNRLFHTHMTGTAPTRIVAISVPLRVVGTPCTIQMLY